MFITLCGIDGAGKTTLGAMLAAELERVWPTPDGRPARVVFRKLVGDNSEVVRYYKILVEVDPLFDGRAQNYIFAFERVRTANTTLRELQQQYDIVIIDRYVYCDIAYSRARGAARETYLGVAEEFGQIVIDGSGDPAHSVEKMVDIVMRARAGAGRQLLGSGIRA